jgi:hypothetical protein
MAAYVLAAPDGSWPSLRKDWSQAATWAQPCALVVYLGFTHGVGFERLSRLMRDLMDLDISEGVLVNILKVARASFSAASQAIRAPSVVGKGDLLG